MTKYVLARAARYNNSTDVLFMMAADDFLLSDPRFAANYTILGEGTRHAKTKTFTLSTGAVYTVFEDGSVAPKEQTA